MSNLNEIPEYRRATSRCIVPAGLPLEAEEPERDRRAGPSDCALRDTRTKQADDAYRFEFRGANREPKWITCQRNTAGHCGKAEPVAQCD